MEEHDEQGGQDNAERLAIRKRAMDLLARREHAYRELVTKLIKREHDRDMIEVVLDQLVDDGLLSDARFAEASAASKARRGVGPVRIRGELMQAGVSEGLIDHALAACEVDWAVLARSVREKRFGPDMPHDFPNKAKQMRFLQGRGFSGDQMAHVFDDD